MPKVKGTIRSEVKLCLPTPPNFFFYFFLDLDPFFEKDSLA